MKTLGLCVVAALMATSISQAQALLPEQACERVKASGPIVIKGRTYRERADLPEELRRLAAIRYMRGCRDMYFRQLEEYRAEHPDDYRIVALDAGDLRIAGESDEALRRLREVLAAHADFASGWMQLAYTEGEKDPMKMRMRLAQVLRLSPDEFLVEHASKVQSAERFPVSEDVLSTLFSTAENKAVSPEFREQALLPIMANSMLPPAVRERAMRLQMTFESTTPQFRKATQLATFLVESGRWREARPMLQAILAEHDWANARNSLALTYLFEAHEIQPEPGPRNAAQIAKAKQILGGDFRNIQGTYNPDVAMKLRAILADPALQKPATRFAPGPNAVCLATSRMDLDGLKVALARGGSADANCDGTTPIGLVVRDIADRRWELKRQVITLLLELGADPDPPLRKESDYSALGFCKDGYPQCKAELLPLLEAAAGERTLAGIKSGKPKPPPSPPPVMRTRVPGDPQAPCDAAKRLDVEALRVALTERGASASANCGGTTPLGLVIANDTDQRWQVKREFITYLLNYAADKNPKLAIAGTPTAYAFCKTSPRCTAELMPLLDAASGGH